jgi:hypothetical protein
MNTIKTCMLTAIAAISVHSIQTTAHATDVPPAAPVSLDDGIKVKAAYNGNSSGNWYEDSWTPDGNGVSAEYNWPNEGSADKVYGKIYTEFDNHTQGNSAWSGLNIDGWYESFGNVSQPTNTYVEWKMSGTLNGNPGAVKYNFNFTPDSSASSFLANTSNAIGVSLQIGSDVVISHTFNHLNDSPISWDSGLGKYAPETTWEIYVKVNGVRTDTSDRLFYGYMGSYLESTTDPVPGVGMFAMAGIGLVRRRRRR